MEKRVDALRTAVAFWLISPLLGVGFIAACLVGLMYYACVLLVTPFCWALVAFTTKGEN